MDDDPTAFEEEGRETVLDLLVAWVDGGQVLSAEELCKDRPDLVETVAREMRRTLRACDALKSLAERAVTPTPPELTGFQIIHLAGEGGMGLVWEALELATKRTVAIKQIRPDLLASEASRARFQSEAELAARLKHPNIARLLSVHQCQGGPVLVMDFVAGDPLDGYVADRELTTRQILSQLMIPICQAVAHAHGRGVIHRDLKPGNILVTTEGTPSILDFGIAKTWQPGVAPYGPVPIEDPKGEHGAGPPVNSTLPGHAPGTLAYLAPEQAAGGQETRTQTDVFGLGAVLFRLLTGRIPYDLNGTKEEVLRRIAAGEIHFAPDRPRGRFAAVDDPEETEPPGPAPDYELRALLRKAMAPIPDDRYATVEALQQDITHYLDREPLAAIGRRRGYGVRKFLRRNWVWVAGVSAILATAIVAPTAHIRRLHAEQARTAAKAHEAETERSAARRQLSDSYVRTGAGIIGDDSTVALLYFTSALAVDPADPVREQGHRMRIAMALRRCPALTRVAPADPASMGDFIDEEGSRDGIRLEPYIDHEEHVYEVRVVDAGTGRPRGLAATHGGTINRAALSPDGTMFVTASRDRTARIWEVATGRALSPPLRHDKEVQWASWGQDGTRIVTGSWDNSARVWDVAAAIAAGAGGEAQPSQRFRVTPNDSAVIRCEFSPDGHWIAVGCYDGRARVWDVASGQPAGPVLRHEGPIWDVCFSGDGTRLLTASRDTAARVWDWASGRAAAPPLRHPTPVLRARFVESAPTTQASAPTSANADESSVAASFGVETVCTDGLRRDWRIATASTPRARIAPEGGVATARFAPDGRRVIISSGKNSVGVWSPDNGPTLMHVLPPPPSGDAIIWAGLDPEGRLLAAGPRQGIYTAPAGDGRLIVTLHAPDAGNTFCNVFSSPDCTRLVTVSSDGAIQLLDGQAGAAIGAPVGYDRDAEVTFSADGRSFTTAGWGAGSPADRHASSPADGRPTAAPGGTRIVGSARLWDAQTGKALSDEMAHGGRVARALFSPDGQRLLTCSWDGTARQWDLHGQPLAIPPLRHFGPVAEAVFSPDGRTIMTASEDHSARLWDAATGTPLSPPLMHEGLVGKISFSADGRWALTSSTLGPRCWEVASGLPVPLPFPFPSSMIGSEVRPDRQPYAQFSPVGQSLLSAGKDGSANIWDWRPDPRPPADLTSLAELLSGSKLEASGALVPLDPREWRSLCGDRGPTLR